MSSTILGTILIFNFKSCVVGTCNILQGSLPGSKCLGEWRKDTLFLLPDAMTIFVCITFTKKIARKNDEFEFHPHK